MGRRNAGRATGAAVDRYPGGRVAASMGMAARCAARRFPPESGSRQRVGSRSCSPAGSTAARGGPSVPSWCDRGGSVIRRAGEAVAGPSSGGTVRVSGCSDRLTLRTIFLFVLCGLHLVGGWSGRFGAPVRAGTGERKCGALGSWAGNAFGPRLMPIECLGPNGGAAGCGPQRVGNGSAAPPLVRYVRRCRDCGQAPCEGGRPGCGHPSSTPTRPSLADSPRGRCRRHATANSILWTVAIPTAATINDNPARRRHDHDNPRQPPRVRTSAETVRSIRRRSVPHSMDARLRRDHPAGLRRAR
ncbi:hypothetical protein LV78_005412 [Actinosynnema pretiosum]|nr:hypothetical protein [Actinosynnema pretiosum]